MSSPRGERRHGLGLPDYPAKAMELNSACAEIHQGSQFTLASAPTALTRLQEPVEMALFDRDLHFHETRH